MTIGISRLGLPTLSLLPPPLDQIEHARVRAEIDTVLFGIRSTVTLGRFELRTRIGSGGMGVVYAAYDPELDRDVALKILESSGESEQARQRLLREAQALARLSHPHVVAIHDVGMARGHVFIALELVNGHTLAEWIDREQPCLESRLQVIGDVGRGVIAAHARGLVHRDIKPANILVDGEGRARLIDFGLARAEANAEHESHRGRTSGARLTRGDALLGTPEYAAPEQLRGEAVDARSDQYSFAATAWEALTGAAPFGGGDIDERLEAIRQGCLGPPPSELPPSIGEALARALEYEPERRHPSMRDLVAALGRSDLRPTPRSRRGAWLLGGFAAVALLGVASFGSSPTPGSEPTRATASAPRLELREPRAGLEALRRYRHPERASASAVTSTTMWTTAADDFLDASRQSGAPPHWLAAHHFASAEALRLAGRLDHAERRFQDAAAADPGWSLPHVGLAEVRSQQRRKTDALAAARRAQVLDARSFIAIVAAARVLATEQELPEAIVEYRRALELSPQNAIVMSELALAYHGAGLDSEAKRTARQVLERDPDLVPARVLLSEQALEDGDGKSALSHAERALGVSPKNLSAWLAKSDALVLLGRFADAKTAYRETLRLAQEVKRRGAPELRLAAVERAIGAGRLPPPRRAPKTAPSRGPDLSKVFGSAALGSDSSGLSGLRTTKLGTGDGFPGVPPSRPTDGGSSR